MSTSPLNLLKHNCLILLRLGQLAETVGGITYDSLAGDARFLRMCNLAQRADYSNHPHLLFAALQVLQKQMLIQGTDAKMDYIDFILLSQGLEKLKVLESSDIYQTLNIELKWGMRRCHVRYLAKAIALSSSGQRTATPVKGSIGNTSGYRRTEILELAIQTLQRRWVEVVSGSDFIAVFKIVHHLDDHTRGKLEDRAVEVVQTFTPSEMRQVC